MSSFCIVHGCGHGHETRSDDECPHCEISRLSAENERLKSRGIEDMKFEIESLSAEGAILREALKPFAQAHKAHFPAEAITLHDLRMAHEALNSASTQMEPE